MNAAALLTLIQGVVSVAPANGASASTPGALTPGAGASSDPTAFAEALAAALAGQGAVPVLPQALSPVPQDAASTSAGAPGSTAATTGAPVAPGAAAAIGGPLTSAMSLVSNLSAGVVSRAAPDAPEGTPSVSSDAVPAASQAAAAMVSTLVGPPHGQAHGSAHGSAHGPARDSAHGSAQGLAKAARAAAADLQSAPPSNPTAAEAVASVTPGIADQIASRTHGLPNRGSHRNAAAGAAPTPPGLAVAREVANASARIAGVRTPAASTAPAASVAPVAPVAPTAADAAVDAAAASPVAASAAVSTPSPAASAPLSGVIAAVNSALEGQAPVLAAAGSGAPAQGGVEAMSARVTGQVTAEVAAPAAPIPSAPSAELAAPASVRSGGAEAPVVLAQAAPVAAELSASAASAIAAEAPEIAGAKETARSDKAQAEPASLDSASQSQTPGVAGPTAQNAAGRDGGNRDQPEGREPLAPEPVPGLEVEESGPDAVLEPASTEAAITGAPAAEGRAAPAVRGAPETVANLAAQIARKLEGRNTRFEIALDPHGLGAVQVSVEINSKGELSAHMSFEKPEAAAELRARAAELQRALEQAGFDLSRGGLHFDNGGGRHRHAEGETGRRAHARAFQNALSTADAADAPPAHPVRFRDHARSGLDLRI